MENCSSTLCPQTPLPEPTRPIAQFHPDIWGDTFRQPSEGERHEEVEELKELVKKELTGSDKDAKEILAYIDLLERLGVAYHFEEEIEVILQKLHDNDIQYVDDSYKNDLHYVALRFRIFREHGFPVSSDVFTEFENEDGTFNESYASDVNGMLNLYEASHQRFHGEDRLERALVYTKARLASFATDPNCGLASQVAHALKLPLLKRTPRLESTYQIKFYASDPSHDDSLLMFAKLDFNLVQVFHRNELREIIRWSENLGLSTRLQFPRDRLVEAYFWTVGAFYEPKYSKARIILNKFFKVISITDDMYDAYGTYEELLLFTDAILRWDRSCASLLPDYMKFFFEIVLDTFEEVEKELANEGRAYAITYLRKEMQNSCENYLLEAKWCHEGYMPTFEEYMRIGIITAGYYYVNIAAIIGMGDIINMEVLEWVQEATKSVKASCVLARAVNDIGTHKFERKRGHVASAVESYMKQFGGTQEEAHEHLALIVEDSWKDIKEDMVRPTAVPMPILIRVSNLCKALHDIYGTDEDGYTMNLFLKSKIEATLVTQMI